MLLIQCTCTKIGIKSFKLVLQLMTQSPKTTSYMCLIPAHASFTCKSGYDMILKSKLTIDFKSNVNILF